MLSFLEYSAYEIIATSIYIINFIVILILIFKEKRSIETIVAWTAVPVSYTHLDVYKRQLLYSQKFPSMAPLFFFPFLCLPEFEYY